MKLARLALVGLAAGSLLAVDTIAYGDPDAVQEAKQELDSLEAEASGLEQEAIEAAAEADQAKARLATIEEDLSAQQAKVDTLADEIGAVAVMQLQQGDFDIAAQLFDNSNDEGFLRSLATIQSETDRANAGMQRLQNDQARLDALRTEAEATKETHEENLAELEAKQGEFEEKIAEADAVYNRLQQEEQERLERLRAEEQARREEQARAEAAAAEARLADGAATSRDESREDSGQSADEASEGGQEEPSTPAPPPADGDRAQRVIDAALAQVGKTYRLASAGPNAFDCSGLVYYAYSQVGISLPRSSRAQYSGAGRAVSTSDIQPGDLVFYYSGPSHVGIYIGGGQIVHAANPRSGITTAGLHSMPLKGVRRVL